MFPLTDNCSYISRPNMIAMVLTMNMAMLGLPSADHHGFTRWLSGRASSVHGQAVAVFQVTLNSIFYHHITSSPIQSIHRLAIS